MMSAMEMRSLRRAIAWVLDPERLLEEREICDVQCYGCEHEGKDGCLVNVLAWEDGCERKWLWDDICKIFEDAAVQVEDLLEQAGCLD